MTIYTTGALTRTALIAETTSGTTPASPVMLVLPDTKIDLEPNQAFYADTSINADRMYHYDIPGLKKVQGSLSGNLSHLNYGPILQSAMFGTFASSVLKTGATMQSFTLEEWHSDSSTGSTGTGCFADKLSIKVPVNGIVTIDATIMGMVYAATTAAIGTSYTAATVEQPFTHLGGTLTEGGGAIASLTSIDLTIDNGATALQVLGTAAPIGYVPGFAKVSGTLSAFFANNTLMNKFLANTASSLSFTLSDGTSTLQFNCPNIIYTSLKKPVSSQGAIVVTMAFEALKDVSTGSNLVITKS